MSAPRVLIISFSNIAADARVLKQVRRLAGEYELHTVGYGPTPEGVAGHVRVPDEYPVWRYDRLAVMARRYTRAYWGNRAISFAADALAGTHWDAVLANDVDSVGLALSLEPAHGVHADLHEYAPRQKEDVTRWRLFVAPFIRWMCRTHVTKAASVTTVADGIAEGYAREFGIRAEVVTNAAPYAGLAPTAVGSPIRLVHSGVALRDRQLHLMAEAAAETASDVTLDFYLTPNDPAYLQSLKDFAATTDRIRVHDPVPYARLVSTLNAYDVGVFVLPPLTYNYEYALPNKFFDFVQARLGVVIGPSPEMTRVLTQHGFGAVTAGFTTSDLREVLDRLDPTTVAEWKRAADASAAELSGESQAEGWARAIARLLGTPS